MTPPPALSRAQVRQVDRIAIEQYGIDGLVLMENAGRGVTDQLGAKGVDGRVVICCGKGNNAGDGFVIARHLELRGIECRVLLWADPEELTGDAAANYRILQKTDVPIDVLGDRREPERLAEQLRNAAWIVDALLGTGARGEPRSPFDTVIDQVNLAGVPVLAVDLPSGLDCDTGRPSAHTIRATMTCTFVAPKIGFAAAEAQPYIGQVQVLDIGAPRKIVDAVRAESVC